MHAVDLTHVIEEQMPVYPGTEGPKLVPANSYAESGFRETCLTMYSHTGKLGDGQDIQRLAGRI